MEIINLDFRIKRLIESKIFVIVVSIITFLCWASNIRFISYAFFSLFLFLIYKTKSNGSSIFSLMMLLFGGDSNYEYKIKPYDILTIIIIAIFGCCALFYIIKDFKNNWFLGTGAGTSKFNIEPLWDEIKQKVFNYHNSVIQMLATCGIIGIISLLFFGVCIYKILKKYNYFSLTIGAVFIYAFVHGLFDTIFVVSISMLFLIALIIIIPNKEYEMLDKEVIE